MKQKSIFLLLMVLCFQTALTQEIIIKNISLIPTDQTAIQKPCLDANGDTCALIRLKGKNISGLEFPNKNQFIKVNAISSDVYEIYVPTITRRLNLKHSEYLPCVIDMTEYGYKRLIQGKTYDVILETKGQKKFGASVFFKIEPIAATLSFNNQQQLSGQGIYEFNVDPGNYSYVVSADDYVTKKGIINLCESETQQVSISLQPIMHLVDIKCNVPNARIFIDDLDYGKVGKLMLPQGPHRIRIQSKGYNDVEQELDITSQTKTLKYNLQRNAKTEHVHPVHVQIFANSSNIYLNGKRIKNWEEGGYVDLMPGTYMFENDNGKTQKVKVERKTTTIYLFDSYSNSKNSGQSNQYNQYQNNSTQNRWKWRY